MIRGFLYLALAITLLGAFALGWYISSAIGDYGARLSGKQAAVTPQSPDEVLILNEGFWILLQDSESYR